MWIVENRARYDRGKLRCPIDLTDAERELAEAEIPRARRGGNKRTVDIRETCIQGISTRSVDDPRIKSEGRLW